MKTRNNSFIRNILLSFLLATFCVQCGGGTTSEENEESDVEETDSTESDPVNTEKLVGTPFEGLASGDDLAWETFLCGKYRTEVIEGFPIKVFAAFFTESEEVSIQAGIDITNEAIGFEAYQLTTDWSDDVRVIYEVNVIANEGITYTASGHTVRIGYMFNSKFYAGRVVTDWIIESEEQVVSLGWLIAHELGHATGLWHGLINYETDSLEELEDNSLMNEIQPSLPELNDYNFMMEKQGTIMRDHLNDTNGVLDDRDCPSPP